MHGSQIRVALDVDGILSNFYLSVCKEFNMPYNTVKEFYQTWIKWDKIKDNVNFWMNLEKLNDPISINFEFEKYLTSIPEDMVLTRKAWLHKNGFPDKEIKVSHYKVEHCKKYGIDVLIDDKPSTIKKAVDNNLFAIQYIPYYSEMKIMTKVAIKHLPEVKPILDEIQLFLNIKEYLPEEVINGSISEFHNSGLSVFKNLVSFLKILFVDSKNASDVLNNLNRWEAKTYKYYYSFLNEKTIGYDKYHAFDLLVDDANGSL